MSSKAPSLLPDYFAPILWSYDVSGIDPERDKKTIIVHTINYGDLKHWRWLAAHYGQAGVRRVLETIPATEFRPRVRRLAAVLFGISEFRHAPRSPQ